MWSLSVADVIGPEIDDGYPQTVLHFAGPEIVQQWPPLLELAHIFGYVFREKNVAGVTAFHDSLCQI